MEVTHRYGQVLVPFFVFLLSVSNLRANETYHKGVVLVRGNEAVVGEYTDTSDGVFIRNDSIGRKILREQLQGIVSEEYYSKIQNSSRGKAAWDSFVYFHAGATYQWNPKKEDSEREDIYIRILKIGLLVTTGIFFWEANKANTAVKNSYLGLSSNAEQKFDVSYRNYQIAGFLTLFTFSYASINAYLRFGSNEGREDLKIPARHLTKFSSANTEIGPFRLLEKNPIEFQITKNF